MSQPGNLLRVLAGRVYPKLETQFPSHLSTVEERHGSLSYHPLSPESAVIQPASTPA